ncbi:MAG: phosphoribosyltransferase [Nitrospirae bacterium]|nr:phosphoribosyltransferase [Nitrospirota bacterium]
MEDLQSLLNTVIRKDYSNGEKIWDEWFFYENVFSFIDVYEKFYDKYYKLTDKFDYICSLGKSGYPLAAKLAFDSKKPLLISSMSEFIYEDRTFILGLPPESANFSVKGKKIFCVDSHTRTGGTIRLANNLITNRQVKHIEYAVLFDCIEDEKHKKSYLKSIKSLYDWETLHKPLNQMVDKSRMLNDDFWMKEDKYWLTYIKTENLKDNVQTLPEINVTTILTPEESKKFITADYINPLDLYLDPKLYSTFINRLLDQLINVDIDTFVALSVASIPIAFNLAIEQQKRFKTKKVKFIFLMNEPLQYYREKMADATGILLCDDVIVSGGLLYAVANLLIGENNNKKVKIIATFFHSLQFPSAGRWYLSSVINQTKAKYIAGISF